MTLKRNDKASRKHRQEGALARFDVDHERYLTDKGYKARKDQELAALKRKLGQQVSNVKGDSHE